MKQTWMEWMESESFSEEKVEMLLEMLQDSDSLEWIAEVRKGFENEEEVANDYFKEGSYAHYAALYQIDDFYILKEDEEDSPVDFVVYDDKQEALEALKVLENSLEMGIDDELELFKEKLSQLNHQLGEAVSVEVKREYNNGGRFYSFDIFYENSLLADGLFSLNAEEMCQLIQTYQILEERLKSKGIYISGIEKSRDQIGFDRYYVFTFEVWVNGDYEQIEKSISLRGQIQGMPRNTLLFFEDLIDEIEDEFNSLKEAAFA